MSRLGAAVLVLILGTACASATTGGPDTTVGAGASSLIVGASGMGLGVANTVTAIPADVPLSPDSTFKLLQAVYTKLQIPVAQRSDVDRTIGNDALKVRRKLAGMNMEQVLDCGNKVGVLSAETWDIQINLVSYVKADPSGGSHLYTRVDAMGHDPSASDRDWIPCESMSNLEAKIAELVKAGVAK